MCLFSFMASDRDRGPLPVYLQGLGRASLGTAKKPKAKIVGGFKKTMGVKSSEAVCVLFMIQMLQRAIGGNKSLTILALK